MKTSLFGIFFGNSSDIIHWYLISKTGFQISKKLVWCFCCILSYSFDSCCFGPFEHIQTRVIIN